MQITKTHLHKIENSPYPSVNEYINTIDVYAKESTRILTESIISVLGLRLKKATDEHAPLVFRGRIQYNPKTGKPITMKQWKALEEAIIKFLGVEKKEMQRKMIQDSLWLGTLIQRMDRQQRERLHLKDIDLSEPFRKIEIRDYDEDLFTATEQYTGTLLTSVSDSSLNRIQTIISEGTRSRKHNYELLQDLRDAEGLMNRDWERVVRTEVATNANNGALLTALRSTDEDYVFMKGVSAPNACKYCKQFVNNQVVVLMKNPPKSGDKISLKGKSYSVIWPGKSNVGRKAANYWTSIIMHPYCRCTWTEWDPLLDEYLKDLKE